MNLWDVCPEWVWDNRKVFGLAVAAAAIGLVYRNLRGRKDEYLRNIQTSEEPEEFISAVVIGLNGSGKTSFLNAFGECQLVNGINKVQRKIGNKEFIFYEVGQSDGFIQQMASWLLQIKPINFVIYVVDSTDLINIGTAKDALMHFTKRNETHQLKLIVIANKQDNKDALKPKEVLDKIKDDHLILLYKEVSVVGTILGEGRKRKGVYDTYVKLSS